MAIYDQNRNDLRQHPKTWLITGAAGFIGSHLTEALLTLGQTVIGLDNFSTGKRSNLDLIKQRVSPHDWQNFHLQIGDIRSKADCERAVSFSDHQHRVDYILHHAAMASVPACLDDPQTAHEINVTGFLNIMSAARDAAITRVIYASSSAVYGDDAAPLKQEDCLGQPLSPYAAQKYMNEIYGKLFQSNYGLTSVGLRYFNIYGHRQDPEGAYAAVIPRWLARFQQQAPIHIYGDGKTTRDFCHIDDVVQANILAATMPLNQISDPIFNIGTGNPLSLNQLYKSIAHAYQAHYGGPVPPAPLYQDFRPQDIRHSCANIQKAQTILHYTPRYTFESGIQTCMKDAFENLKTSP